MQAVKTPYEIDDITLINTLFPKDPTQAKEKTVTHLTEEEAEEIFRQADAEIQPILRDFKRWKRRDFMYGLAEFLCFCIFLFSIAGIFWQCITYPHTLVVIYTKATPATITTTLDVPTRTLAPVTITRSAAIATTGTGHQDATRATGQITFYNGQSQSIIVPSGSVFTGRDGEQILIIQDAVIPAADFSTTPPKYGY